MIHKVEFVDKLCNQDLYAISVATNASIEAGGGINRWKYSLSMSDMIQYWASVLNDVRNGSRYLCVSRLKGIVVGSAQLVVSSRPFNDVAAHAGQIVVVFVAPWARRMNFARDMLQLIEKKAISLGLETLELSVRSSQTNAIHLYESLGFVQWGVQPLYAKINETYYDGYFYIKQLTYPQKKE